MGCRNEGARCRQKGLGRSARVLREAMQTWGVAGGAGGRALGDHEVKRMEERAACEKQQNGREWTTSVFLMLPWASDPPGAQNTSR